MNSCEVCNKVFSCKSSLKRHEEKIHGITYLNSPDFKLYIFEEKQEFLEWKSKIELQTHSSYTSVVTKNKSDIKYHYYECSRSGKYKPGGKGKRRRSTSKIGRRCPSRIVMSEREKVYVKFFPNHEGHEIDFRHLRLPKATREFVAGKLKAGVSLEKILDEVKGEATSTNAPSRSSLITRKDIRNIKNACKIEDQRHNNGGVGARVDISEHVSNSTDHKPVFQNPSEANRDLIDLAQRLIDALRTQTYDEKCKSELEILLRNSVLLTQQSNQNSCKSVETNLKRKIDEQIPQLCIKKENTKIIHLKKLTNEEVKSMKESLLHGQKVLHILNDSNHTYLNT